MNTTDAGSLSKTDIKELLHDFIELIESNMESRINKALMKVLVESGNVKRFISKTEAYGFYGRVAVDRWIREGYLRQHKDADGSFKCRIDRLELDKVAAQMNHRACITSKRHSG